MAPHTPNLAVKLCVVGEQTCYRVTFSLLRKLVLGNGKSLVFVGYVSKTLVAFQTTEYSLYRLHYTGCVANHKACHKQPSIVCVCVCVCVCVSEREREYCFIVLLCKYFSSLLCSCFMEFYDSSPAHGLVLCLSAYQSCIYEERLSGFSNLPGFFLDKKGIVLEQLIKIFSPNTKRKNCLPSICIPQPLHASLDWTTCIYIILSNT